MKLQHVLIALICSPIIVVQSFAQDESGPMIASLPISPDELSKALGDRYLLERKFSKEYVDDFVWSGSIGEDEPGAPQTRVDAFGRNEDNIHQINMLVFSIRDADIDAIALRDFAFINTLFKDADVEKWLRENIASKATMEVKGMTLSLNPVQIPEDRLKSRWLSIYIASTKQKPSRVWQIEHGKFEAKLLKVTAESIFVQGSDGAVVKIKKQDLSAEELEWVKSKELAD